MLYTLTNRDDPEEIFNYTDTNEELLNGLGCENIIHYRTKTIKSGNVLESEVYPIWKTKGVATVLNRKRKCREAQRNLNYKNSVKNLIRLINANFTDADIWGTFTYEPKKLPRTIEEAQAEMQKFIRRLKYYAARHGLPPLKYVYVTQFGTEGKRVHHHIVINFPDRDIAEKMWRNGARTHTRRLQADESGYEGLTRYIAKHPQGLKRYVTSKNLTKPQIYIADHKFTRRMVNKIAHGQINAVTVFENIYKNYNFVDYRCYTSEYVSGAYLYIKMLRRKQ